MVWDWFDAIVHHPSVERMVVGAIRLGRDTSNLLYIISGLVFTTVAIALARISARKSGLMQWWQELSLQNPRTLFGRPLRIKNRRLEYLLIGSMALAIISISATYIHDAFTPFKSSDAWDAEIQREENNDLKKRIEDLENEIDSRLDGDQYPPYSGGTQGSVGTPDRSPFPSGSLNEAEIFS